MLYDIIYYTSLIMCMSLGSYYKKIEDHNTKRNYGAGLGVLTACIICGHHIYHTAIMVWGNIIIIKCCNRHYAYQISLAYTWTYLLYLHLNFQHSTYIIWLHQTIALRMVGLAFEMKTIDKVKFEKSTSEGERAPSLKEPSTVDIIAYSYFFIGLHKGPYYKWKTFKEHFEHPFGVLGNCRIITRQKLKKAVMCTFAYLLLKMNYPSDLYYDDVLYTCYAADFRYLYNIPQLVMYFLKYQVLMMLSTSVCTEAGFGVYPAKCQPLPGHGPTARLSLLNLASISATEMALDQEYNFTMLKCFDNEKLLFGPSMRDTMRGWNLSTRYWFWENIYKMPVKANKELRKALSFLIWTMWCGPTLQNLIGASTLWVHLHLEKEYTQLYNTKGPMKTAWDVGFSIMRVLCLIYLTPCGVVEDDQVIFKYYNSIFWVYHILLIILIIAAVVISKSRLNASFIYLYIVGT